MTHQLLLNFDNYIATSSSVHLPPAYNALLRDALEVLIERHGESLWGRNQIMRGPVDLLRGSQDVTLEAKSRKLACQVTEADVDAAKYDRQGVVDIIVENVAAEFKAELNRHAASGNPVNLYPYVLLIPSSPVADPVTLQPVVGLVVRYATRPVKQTTGDDGTAQKIAIT